MTTITQSVTKAVNAAFESKQEQFERKRSAYEKTEQLLINYTKIKELIKSKLELLDELKTHGIRYESKSIMEYQDYGERHYGLESREESTSGMIKSVTEDLVWLNKVIFKVDSALSDISDDEHYDIIPRLYFEKESPYDIGDDYSASVRTVYRWKNQLISKLAISLFPKESLNELMEE